MFWHAGDCSSPLLKPMYFSIFLKARDDVDDWKEFAEEHSATQWKSTLVAATMEWEIAVLMMLKTSRSTRSRHHAGNGSRERRSHHLKQCLWFWTSVIQRRKKLSGILCYPNKYYNYYEHVLIYYLWGISLRQEFSKIVKTKKDGLSKSSTLRLLPSTQS